MAPLALVYALVAIILTATAVPTYTTKSLCTTRYGTKSVPPKSTGYTLTVPVTYQKKTTITLTATITPPPDSTTTTTTTTVTDTETTTPTSTITSTVQETETDTETATTTTTTTTTVTTTSTPPASTVPAAAGFTPLANSPGYVPKKRDLAIRKPEKRAKDVIYCPPIGKPGHFSPALYPTSTICGTLVIAATTITKTSTASKKATITLPPVTNTQTETNTATTTTTVAGNPSLTTVTTTQTQTTTTTTTVTETLTDTLTQTVVAPTPTTYAQCSANNVIGSANGGHGIYQPGYAIYNGVSINQVAITDPTQCCATCAQATNCIGYSQYPGGPCYYYTVPSAQCNGAGPPNSNLLVFTSSSSVAAGAGYIIGNGQCGQFYNAGDA